MFKIHTHREFTELQTDRDSLLAKVQGYENEIKNLQSMSKDMTEQCAAHNAVIDELKKEQMETLAKVKADYEKQISDLKAQVEMEANSSEKRAIETLAKIGVPMEELPKANVVTSQDLVATYESKRGNERIAFFNENKVAILNAYKSQRG